MAKKSTLITLGTTPMNLVQALRDTAYSGVTLSKSFGSQLNDQCRALQIKCDSGTLYIGDDSLVSSTNYGTKLLAGESKFISDAEANSLNLSDYWFVGGGAGVVVSVEWTTI